MAGSPLIAQPVVATSSVPTPAPGTPTWQDYARWMAANQDKVGTPTYKAMSNAFQQLRPADKDVASAGTAFHKSALGVAEDVAQLGADATAPTAASTGMGGKRPFTTNPTIEATPGLPGVSNWFQGSADSFKKTNEAIPYKSMTRKDINGPLDALSYGLHKTAEAGPYLMAGVMAPEVSLPAMGVMGAASMNNRLRKEAPGLPVSNRMGLSVGVGAIQAALGTLGIGTIFKGMPASRLEALGAQGVADYISKSGYGPAMASRFLNVVGAMGTNAVTMPAIEGANMAAEGLAGKKFAPGEVAERINEGVASGVGMAGVSSAAHEVPGAAFDTAKQATPTARGIRAIESNPVHAASDLRLGNAYRIEEADIKAADPRGKANADEIVRNVWTRLKDAVKNPLKELRDQGQIGEDAYRRLMSVQDRAAVSLKRLTASDLRSIDRDLAGLDPKYAETIKNGLIDLDSASYHFKVKNTRGPVEFVTRHVGPAAVTGALAATGHPDLAAVTGVTSLLSSKAGDVTGGVGRIVDRALGWNKPELIRRLPSLQKGATALGFEQGKDSYAPLDDLRANAEAGRIRSNTPEANLAAQSRSLRAETRMANEVAEGGYDNMTYLKTGLRPDQVDRGLMILAARKQIPAQVLTQFYNNPRAMMRGGVGLQVHDALNRLVRSGDLTRDPDWKPTVPSVSPVAPTGGLTTNTGADPAVIYNPRAYDKVTGAAAKHADEVAHSAPTIELQGATRQVERAVSKEEKAAVVDKALAADPARSDWINKILRPLVDYGNPRGSNGSVLRDESGGLDIARLKELATKGKDALSRFLKDESGGVKLERDELDKGAFHLKNEAGDHIGYVKGSYDPTARDFYVHSIQHNDGPQALGPREILSLRRQLKQFHPDLETVSGNRVTGARWGQAATGASASPAGSEVKMSLRDFLRNDAGSGPSPLARFEGDQSHLEDAGFSDKERVRPEASALSGKMRNKDGSYRGAPDGIDSPQALGTLRKSLYNAATEGKGGRFWYERSGRAILNAMGGNKAEAEKLAQLVAIFSQSTPVKSNFDYALQAYAQFQQTGEIRSGRFPTEQSKKAQAVMEGKPWEGRKTNNFYVNLMREIDPSSVQGVTADIWMMRAFGYEGANGKPYSGSPTEAQYDFVERETSKVMDRLNADLAPGEAKWEPQQVQAAIWIAAKAKHEGTSVDAAAYDYSNSLDNSLAQVSWESIPGKTSGVFPEMHNAPLAQRAEYHVAVSKAFLDAKGGDIIAKGLGVLTPGEFEAPGYFEGNTNPGSQSKVAAPRKYLSKAAAEIEPTAVEQIDAYAIAKGIALKQDAMAWHRPFFNPKVKDANGVQVNIGRTLSVEENARLGENLAKVFGNGDIGPIGAEKGARILNLSDLPNKEFQKRAQQAVDMTFGDDPSITPDLGTFAYQGNYLTNDWSKAPNGEKYYAALAEGRPDLHRKVRDVLAKVQPRLDAINEEFAQRYGWTGHSPKGEGVLSQAEAPEGGSDAGVDGGVLSQ
jgi:hypothetical protein